MSNPVEGLKTSPSCARRPGAICTPANLRRLASATEESSGTRSIDVDWSAGVDVPVGDARRWVQRKEQKQEPVRALGGTLR